MNKKIAASLPLMAFSIWNSYLIIFMGIRVGDLPSDLLGYLVLLVVVSIFPPLLVFFKWETNISGLVISGFVLLSITIFWGWVFLSSGDVSSIFILIINWIMLWIVTIILFLIPNRNNSNG